MKIISYIKCDTFGIRRSSVNFRRLKMKLILVAAVLTLFLALGDATRCRSGDDCEENECCVKKIIFSIRSGRCQKLGQAGDRCSEKDDTSGFMGNYYIGHCSCSAGLKCEPEDYIDLPFGGRLKKNERCIADISSTTPAEPETEEPEPETEEPEPETDEPEPEPETEEPEPEPETEEPEPEPETEEPAEE